MKIKIKSTFQQLVLMQFSLSIWIKFFQDSPVLSQDVIDISHMVRRCRICLIVECVSASIRAELLIYPTKNRLFALRTFAILHDANVLNISNKINYKRLQTDLNDYKYLATES